MVDEKIRYAQRDSYARAVCNLLRRDYNKGYAQTHLLCARKYQIKKAHVIMTYAFHNAETQNRTADTAVFSRMLYQLSYLGAAICYFMRIGMNVKPSASKKSRCLSVVIDEQTPRENLRGYLPTQTPMRGDNLSKRRRRRAIEKLLPMAIQRLEFCGIIRDSPLICPDKKDHRSNLWSRLQTCPFHCLRS